MRRSIITTLENRRVTAEEEDGRITGLFLEDSRNVSLVGRIYVGRIKHIVKNINAAFVEIEPQVVCYYPLEEWKQYPTEGVERHSLCEGDSLLLQIEKDALKTKAPTATTKLTFTGQYLVLMTGKKGIHFSSKIKNPERKDALRQLLLSSGKLPDFCGFIVRTNGENAPDEAILREKETLSEKLRQILKIWNTRTACTLLYEPEPAFLSEIFNNRLSTLAEIVTDHSSVFDLIEEKKKFLTDMNPGITLPSLRLYEDSYPLSKLYSLETALEKACREKVWLKSGGSLVIEPTEALVSIDVNTGKFDGKKNLEDTFFKTNLEAAEEIAVQLRLRNLSGIIIVDFIDMSEPEHKEELLTAFKRALDKDPVKTTLLGYTRLNLIELTRKKVRKSLHELIKPTDFVASAL